MKNKEKDVVVNLPFSINDDCSSDVVPFGNVYSLSEEANNEILQKLSIKKNFVTSKLEEFELDNDIAIIVRGNNFHLYSQNQRSLKISRMIVEAFLSDFVLKHRLGEISNPECDSFLKIHSSDIEGIFNLIQYERSLADGLIGCFSQDNIYYNTYFPFIFDERWENIVEKCENCSDDEITLGENYSGYEGLFEDGAIADFACILSAVLSEDEIQQYETLLKLYDAGQFYRSSLDSECLLDLLRELWIINSVGSLLLIAKKEYDIQAMVGKVISKACNDNQETISQFSTYIDGDEFLVRIKSCKKNKEFEFSYFDLYVSNKKTEQDFAKWLAN